MRRATGAVVAGFAFIGFVGLVALAGAARAGQRTGADWQARDWAASCMTCHDSLAGSRGDKTPLIPPLAGRPADRIVAAMRAFRADAVASTVMHQIAVGYSDAEVARIAAYLATHPDTDAP